MAKDKKSFLLYSDLIHTVEKVPDEIAGKLFKTILEYVNDKNPEVDDLMLEVLFEPIKQQLKRDLVKYEDIRGKKSKAGKASAEAKKKRKQQSQHPLTPVESVEHTPTDSTVNDNVSVSDTVSDTKINIKELQTNFLNLFNNIKKSKGMRSNFKTLDNTSRNNLKKLRESYGKEEFTIAINNMLEAEWPKETGNQTPSHVLRISNFDRYLSIGEKRELTMQEKLAGKHD